MSLDDHTCRVIHDSDGQPVATAHCAPDISPAAEAALAGLVAAAHRLWEDEPPEYRAVMSARFAAAQERIRKRNRRLFGGAT